MNEERIIKWKLIKYANEKRKRATNWRNGKGRKSVTYFKTTNIGVKYIEQNLDNRGRGGAVRKQVENIS